MDKDSAAFQDTSTDPQGTLPGELSSASQVPGWVIRPMHIGDLEQVVAVDQMSFNLPWPASAYRYELNENPLSSCWVAEVSAQDRLQVIGFIVIWLILDEAHVATIAVHPDFRNQGVGQALLARGLLDAIQSGAVLATLEVRLHNASAQALYRRFGFEIIGRRPRYYKDNNEDALIMTVTGLGPHSIQRLRADL